MTAIATVGLEKCYQVGFWRKRPRPALLPLDLSVEVGEVFGYLGPNGAGKTTTLKLLMGLIHPTGGSATILGRPLDDPQMKTAIGFLPEQPYFYDHLTARELVEYLAALSGVPGGERSRRTRYALERVGLGRQAGVQLRKFSKGMLQRVGIAQAIVHDPRLIFLDEPMSGLDPVGRREVRDLIQELKDEGKTIFFSTHILSDAETLCDRVAVLNMGQLRGIGVVAELTREISGRVELVWEETVLLRAPSPEIVAAGGAAAALTALRAEIHASGSIRRALLAESQLDRALEALLGAGVRIISVTPVRTTLEDFFLERLRPEAEPQSVAGSPTNSDSLGCSGERP